MDILSSNRLCCCFQQGCRERNVCQIQMDGSISPHVLAFPLPPLRMSMPAPCILHEQPFKHHIIQHAHFWHACPGTCAASHARYLDTAVEPTGRWLSLKAAVTHLNKLDPARFPVVLLSVSSLACVHGCCVVSMFIRPGDTDGWVLLQVKHYTLH